MSKEVNNPPAAEVLMDSMRAIGYTFNAAVADIIDNSISAEATHVSIFVGPKPSDIYLCFLDNGNGMDADELRVAMKYGSKGKDEERKEDDLGRFGLGLKSASLSQCTKLTVATKKDGKISADCWDLAVVKARKGWVLLELEPTEISQLPHIQDLEAQEQGTLVIWQDFDVIRQINNGSEYEGLLDNLYDACDYLGLVFHRFLSEPHFSIDANGRPIEPVDPFLESNKKTEVGKPNDITVPDENGVERHITVTTYLLPYLKDLTEDDKKKLGGVARISTMQGFYVYRNNRLIIYGTWFRMSYRNELAKYARIMVDIPSSLDSIWKIDIRKQSAELPPIIKRQLQKCVETANVSSRRKNEHRLAIKDSDPNSLWQKNLTRDKKAVYKINRESPVIRQIVQSLSSEDTSKVTMLLDLIEKSIPFHDMYTDEANDNIDVELTEEDKAQMVAYGALLIKQGKQTFNEPYSKLIDDLMVFVPTLLFVPVL